MIGAIVPAGGAGRRMGGVDKAALLVGGIPLLDRVLAAARPVCDRLVVVGPKRPTSVPDVEFVVEEEPGGGPVPAVLAGLAVTGDCDVILVLAGDLPLLSEADLRRLLGRLDAPEVDAAAAAHGDTLNPLLAAYRATVLRSTAAGLPTAGTPAGRLLPPATLVVDLGRATLNVNRAEDLAAAEAVIGRIAGTDDFPRLDRSPCAESTPGRGSD